MKITLAQIHLERQFFMTWIVAIVYAKVAGRFDDHAHELIRHLKEE